MDTTGEGRFGSKEKKQQQILRSLCPSLSLILLQFTDV